jgi:hypothetical protein
MLVEVKQAAKGQVIEFTLLYPTRHIQAKVVKTRKNAVTVEVVDINTDQLYILSSDQPVTIVEKVSKKFAKD